jgi:hypothetical protein
LRRVDKVLLVDIQPTIDAASGRTPAAETLSALDFLDERIRQHLEGNKGPRRRPDNDPDQPWTAPAVDLDTAVPR